MHGVPFDKVSYCSLVVCQIILQYVQNAVHYKLKFREANTAVKWGALINGEKLRAGRQHFDSRHGQEALSGPIWPSV